MTIFFLSTSERQTLASIATSVTQSARSVFRAKVLLCWAQGQGPSAIARTFSRSRKTVTRALLRYQTLRQNTPRASVLGWLRDSPRLGRPDTYDESFWVDLLALVTQPPSACGRPITHWTCEELAAEMILKKRATRLVASTVSRFLKSCLLKPHQVKEWMNRPDDPEFEPRVASLKALLSKAVAPRPLSAEVVPGFISREQVVVSFDEKTGMQAKEQVKPEKPMQSGIPCRKEFEYKRHGTLVLFAMMLVHNGILFEKTGARRTNEETAAVLKEYLQVLLHAGARRIDMVLDQLNTHYSGVLVANIAELCGVKAPAEAEQKTGKQRRAWLESEGKAIVFHFTPKHASWLNPVEIWFGVLMRKVLKRGSFCSTEELALRVTEFVKYYNLRLAHPYRLKPYKVAS